MNSEEYGERLLEREEKREKKRRIGHFETVSVMREVDKMMESKGLKPVDYKHQVKYYTWKDKNSNKVKN
jgi:pyridoxal biosynthesis lyase PdxS